MISAPVLTNPTPTHSQHQHFRPPSHQSRPPSVPLHPIMIIVPRMLTRAAAKRAGITVAPVQVRLSGWKE